MYSASLVTLTVPELIVCPAISVTSVGGHKLDGSSIRPEDGPSSVVARGSTVAFWHAVIPSKNEMESSVNKRFIDLDLMVI